MVARAFTGNILGEATTPIGNNLLEAMRQRALWRSHAACAFDWAGRKTLFFSAGYIYTP